MKAHLQVRRTHRTPILEQAGSAGKMPAELWQGDVHPHTEAPYPHTQLLSWETVWQKLPFLKTTVIPCTDVFTQKNINHTHKTTNMLSRSYWFSSALQQQLRPQLGLQRNKRPDCDQTMDRWGWGCFIQRHLCIQDLRQESVPCKHPHKAPDQRSASSVSLPQCADIGPVQYECFCPWENFSFGLSQHWSGLFIPSQCTLALSLLIKGRWEQTQTILQHTVTIPLLLTSNKLLSLFLSSCSRISHSSCPRSPSHLKVLISIPFFPPPPPNYEFK